MMRKLAGPAAERSRIFSSSGSPTTVSFAITRTFFSRGSPSPATRCSTGTEPAAERIRSRTPRRSQPDFSSGWVETRTSSTGGSSVASETVVGEPLLEKIRERSAAGPASFLIISPQSDPSAGDHPEAERRLKRALAQLRGEGIDVHGQVAHPDPFSAAMEAVHDERVDEILVSTFEPLSSGWLRKDLVERLRKETGVPVEHVVVDRTFTEVPA